MQGLEDHCFRFAGDEFFNGLPAQLVDKWSAWGVKAAVGYNSSSSILKFLQLIKLSRTGATPNRAQQSNNIESVALQYLCKESSMFPVLGTSWHVLKSQ